MLLQLELCVRHDKLAFPVPSMVRLHQRKLSEQARMGESVATSIFARAGEALGLALTTLMNTLDLELYVIGGGVAQAWPVFAPVMFKVLEQRSIVYRLSRPDQLERRERDRPFITRAALGSDSGLIGAALLPLL
jgi:glucokinase